MDYNVKTYAEVVQFLSKIYSIKQEYIYRTFQLQEIKTL